MNRTEEPLAGHAPHRHPVDTEDRRDRRDRQDRQDDARMERVTFTSRGVPLAAHLRLPPGFEAGRRHTALVCVHPGNGVKEQTAGIYARHMAERGHVTLVFDASHQGESGGEPRHLEDPGTRVEDIRSAVDFLTTLPFVDEERIGVLGVCAGGGYAVNAALSEHRIRAVGTVVPVNIGRARRAGGSPVALLAEAGRRRTAEARGGDPELTTWLPEDLGDPAEAGITDVDLIEAIDYYLTPRGGHPRSANRLAHRSLAPLLAFDAYHLVEELLDRPLQVVVGDRAGSFGSHQEGHELFARARGPKDLLVVEGASHYDLYDRPAHVDRAVEALTAFYARHL
ncbi:alpha/beta hydrolase [Streptomyces sp. ME02-6978.2a]|uniref:alpha/beta hydrolase n=1 Tax=Streptomyces sp. ME02-6978.2a TaxID=462922 RepID=UPI0029A931BD|nr:alpha/beta hydrolase [Streptomyces sp. ME02-6978.2a]MDX3363973.1 alpha/beta hydrolase [Streptomyces sp. ME02-6978.2a]